MSTFSATLLVVLVMIAVTSSTATLTGCTLFQAPLGTCHLRAFQPLNRLPALQRLPTSIQIPSLRRRVISTTTKPLVVCSASSEAPTEQFRKNHELLLVILHALEFSIKHHFDRLPIHDNRCVQSFSERVPDIQEKIRDVAVYLSEDGAEMMITSLKLGGESVAHSMLALREYLARAALLGDISAEDGALSANGGILLNDFYVRILETTLDRKLYEVTVGKGIPNPKSTPVLPNPYIRALNIAYRSIYYFQARTYDS